MSPKTTNLYKFIVCSENPSSPPQDIEQTPQPPDTANSRNFQFWSPHLDSYASLHSAMTSPFWRHQLLLFVSHLPHLKPSSLRVSLITWDSDFISELWRPRLCVQGNHDLLPFFFFSQNVGRIPSPECLTVGSLPVLTVVSAGYGITWAHRGQHISTSNRFPWCLEKLC